jgi:plastocyanin
MISASPISFNALATWAPVWIAAVIGTLGASTITGTVKVIGAQGAAGNSGAALWLIPKSGPAPGVHLRVVRMLQQHKQFRPHVLAIQVGTTVDFPNLDPIFHNAFSNIDGQPFDVGLYPPGSSRRILFHKAGIVRVFCNIHESMSAVIVVEDTPWLAVSNNRGEYSISGAPPGEYTLHIFYERATTQTLEQLTRTVAVGASDVSLPALRISGTGYIPVPHLNKHGAAYPPEEQGGTYGKTR